jgi:hypothetical protein
MRSISVDKVTVVNMIPQSLSGETNQDSEPSLAVNPGDTLQIAGTAFSPNPNGGANSPIYISTDGGNTWALIEVIPGTPVRDQTIRFAWSGGNLYAGVLWGSSNDIDDINYDILSTADLSGNTLMKVLNSRTNVDQPFIQAMTVTTGADAGNDRIYVGENDYAPASAPTPEASIDYSLNAGLAAPVFNTARLDPRTNASRDLPQTRPTISGDGTVYAAYYSAAGSVANNYGVYVNSANVVVVRNDPTATNPSTFSALTDPSDNKQGKLVVTGINVPFANFPTIGWDYMGNQRMLGDLSLVVDPNNSANVYLVYGAETTAGLASSYTLHVIKSTNSGGKWTGDLTTVVGATNPSLAINSQGRVGFLYQQVVGTSPSQQWQTVIQLTTDDWSTPSTSYTLADMPIDSSTYLWDPYLGDYLYLMSVGLNFYGVFCAENIPNTADFPSGITFQRNADWNAHVLKDLNNNNVATSIDPYFFSVVEPLKIDKELKVELKEFKEIKETKVELKEFKEIKELKAELKEFKEIKEVDKIIVEGKNYKAELPEKPVVEIKTFDVKTWDVKLTDGYNPVNPGYIGDPEMLRIMAGRVDQMEESLATLRSFINENERPQLGEEALKKASDKKKGAAAARKEGRTQE